MEFKKRGFWTKHNTISLYNNESALKAFACWGKDLEAMKKSAVIAHEISTITMDADKLLSWKLAKDH